MKNISGIDELDNFILENNNMVMLLYFGAEWCGPCKQLKKRLAEPDTLKILPNLAVCHIDVDEDSNEKIVKKYKISSLPTQIYVKLNNNKVIEISRIEGYDFTRLKIEYDNYVNS